MSFSFSSSGDFGKVAKDLQRFMDGAIFRSLERYGDAGVAALARVTPTDTGATAQGWGYRIRNDRSSFTIEWYNTNVNDGAPIAILIQYGHGTGTGGYVSGREYINGAIQPIFDKMIDALIEEVSR